MSERYVRYWERIPAKPTFYHGVQMRSRLEARVANLLDDLGVAWTYEPRAFRCEAEGGIPAGEYLPDFQIGPHTYVEVKPDAVGCFGDAMGGWWVLANADPDAWLWLLRSGRDGLRAQLFRAPYDETVDPDVDGLLALCGRGHMHVGPSALCGDLSPVVLR